jgi:hypothetical protein
MNFSFRFFVCTIFFLSLTLSSCSNSRGTIETSYTGTWDVRYNLSIDDCGLVGGSIPGFIDVHFIEETAEGLQFSTTSGIIVEAIAQIRADGSLLVEDNLAGDLFGDGSFCEFRTAISYQDLAAESASSLLAQTLLCNDGFSCESLGVGQATRQPL